MSPPATASPGPVVTAGRPADASLPVRRRLVHGVMIVAGWLLFAWGWWRVSLGRPDLGELRVLVLATLVVVPVVMLSWVLHNVGIYRRKGPRRAGRTVTVAYERDFNDRRVVADWDRLRAARRIDIVIEGGTKRFVVRDLPQPRQPQTEPAAEVLP